MTTGRINQVSIVKGALGSRTTEEQSLAVVKRLNYQLPSSNQSLQVSMSRHARVPTTSLRVICMTVFRRNTRKYISEEMHPYQTSMSKALGIYFHSPAEAFDTGNLDTDLTNLKQTLTLLSSLRFYPNPSRNAEPSSAMKKIRPKLVERNIRK